MAVMSKKKGLNTSKKKGSKFVYFFGNGKAEGDASMRQLLGGKGANLAEMTNLGIPVPPGFTITTEACDFYYKLGRKFPPGLKEEVDLNLAKLEDAMKANFGDKDNPLLVSVRSGAAVSMPGMMDTVLNLGLNSDTVQGLIIKTENERFAWDSYRRFIQMFGDVVMEVPRDEFEKVLSEKKAQMGVTSDTDLTANDLKDVVRQFKRIYKDHTGQEFPTNPPDQLDKAIGAVFGSWHNARAIKYRQLHDIRGLLGTAVNVQSMVFGNMGENCGTGVCFTRDPATGQKVFYGEYLVNAQGEDVVAGIRTPEPISRLKERMPSVYQELFHIKDKLERHYRDMQDIEFTAQEGRLFILQTRSGKRTAHAAVQIACDLVKEKFIDWDTALLRVDAKSLDQLLHPTFDPKTAKNVIAKGLPASPGAACGRVVFSAEHAEHMAKSGEKVILVRIETSPEDVGGMHAAEGILTARGGMTSHAAVVARGMGKCCVASCGALVIDYEQKLLSVGGNTVREGEFISLNGSTGEVYLGQVKTVEPELSGSFARLMSHADRIRRLKVRTNADTPHDSQVARKYGAEGIGLCRTEHMFFEGDRILAMREMILAETVEGRERALAKLLPMQRQDFEGIFKAMDGYPVTIRLLDPPLHEFIPHDEEAQREMAQVMNVSLDKVKARVKGLSEFNPMLGQRGCRLGIMYPEIYAMQVQAIIEAALNVRKKSVKVLPEIMIPLVGIKSEFSKLKEIALKTIHSVFETRREKVSYLMGTMIEIPRAAVIADRIAEEADFFSFGTNDLTQMCFGFSRDDVGMFLGKYLEDGILERDPFQSLDQEGVGALVRWGIERGRRVRQNLKVGICGEHGGDPVSVEFCHRVGMDYVSCSPYRVPIARLAAAQAMIREKMSAKKKNNRK